LNSPGYQCTSLTVPLDRSGPLPGSVTLQIERRLAGSAPSEDAVVALAGGPGQAAIPFAQDAAQSIAPALGSRDLIVFDQRGTGASGPLQCPVLESFTPLSIGSVFEKCALQIGATRGAYTTQESVADIEAIRQALGYQRLALFGVSYGTKVALEYAEAHPTAVEALVLDSVVPTGVSDPFSLSSFAAMSSVLSELCSANACAHITKSPVGDLARLAAHMHAHALKGFVYDGAGHRRAMSMSEPALLDLVYAGDLNPALRALLPAAVQSALRGDNAPLLRLDLLSEGLIPNVPLPHANASPRRTVSSAVPIGHRSLPAQNAGILPSAAGGVDEALFVDTTCEEAPFPWQRSASASTRLSEARAALHALPSSAFYPFDASTEWTDGVFAGCARWPNVAPAPPAPTALPQVPTLLLSGAQDVRTPTSNARTLLSRIPGAQLLVVPYTGHSVLGSDFSGCAQAAVKAFFAGDLVQPCKQTSNIFTPTSITPTRLASVKPVPGLGGRAGSTLAVALDTILDLERQVIGARLQAEQELPSGSSFGGLRGGYARLSSSALVLHSLSFVNGVALTGTFPIRHGRLVRSAVRVEGREAARGTIHIGGSPVVAGQLGRSRFAINISKVKLARASTASTLAPSSSGSSSLGAGFASPSLGFPHPGLAHLP
jgi:pimeloyl-ACP methyl ester carboxylesterase